MQWDDVDWSVLKRLRQGFLGEKSAGLADYWDDKRTLDHYDLAFAPRIGWKWDAVLAELKGLGWTPPAGSLVLDWGCGTGIASRRFAAEFPKSHTYRLWDRSAVAREFAGNRLQQQGEAFENAPTGVAPEAPFILLLSHVVNELDTKSWKEVVRLFDRASVILWIEPGTGEASRKLIECRESLLPRLFPVAPCGHAARCGMQTSANKRHWCHHFAAPASEVFTQAHWDKFSRELGVDRRSLPVSYLVMDQTPRPVSGARVIGRARMHKGDAQWLGCDATGVSERRVLKKKNPEFFERLDEGGFSIRCAE